MLHSRKLWLFVGVALMAVITACGPGGACESDVDREARLQNERYIADQMSRLGAAAAAQKASATATAPAAPKATGTTAPAAAAKASGATAPAAAATPIDFGTPSPTATPSTYGGSIGLGFDHPPFGPGNGNLGGASAGIVCGSLTGLAGSGFTVTVNLSGGTGAPASVTGPIGGDGKFSIPFAINSYGPMNASIGGIKAAAGAAPQGSVAPASLEVGGGPDVACSPR